MLAGSRPTNANRLHMVASVFNAKLMGAKDSADGFNMWSVCRAQQRSYQQTSGNDGCQSNVGIARAILQQHAPRISKIAVESDCCAAQDSKLHIALPKKGKTSGQIMAGKDWGLVCGLVSMRISC